MSGEFGFSSVEMSDEAKQEALRLEKIKAESNLELARRSQEGQRPFAEREVEELPAIYAESIIAEKMKEAGVPVLFTDIDKTFYDESDPQASRDLADLLERSGTSLVYVTARNWPDCQEETVRELREPPQPDVYISFMGTKIYVRQKSGEYKQDMEFEETMNKEWHSMDVAELLKGVVEEINDEDVVIPERQPLEYAITIHVMGNDNDKIKLALERLETALPNELRVFFWTGAETDRSYITVLPASGGKMPAVNYLSDKLGINKAVTAGDSCSDVEMITSSKHPGILVGGSAETAIAAVQQASDHRWGSFGVSRENGNIVYLASQQVAGGVKESLMDGWVNPWGAKDVFIEETSSRLKNPDL